MLEVVPAGAMRGFIPGLFVQLLHSRLSPERFRASLIKASVASVIKMSLRDECLELPHTGGCCPVVLGQFHSRVMPGADGHMYMVELTGQLPSAWVTQGNGLGGVYRYGWFLIFRLCACPDCGDPFGCLIVFAVRPIGNDGGSQQ